MKNKMGILQWSGLHAFTAMGTGSVLARELGSHKPRGQKKKKNTVKLHQREVHTPAPQIPSLNKQH